ncbi:MAG: PQQ-binding-like beta-propeller repeat protein [Pirellulaceae bacterium]|nr:PQQ-binding-like beta-propeller repeat protein [Pirellulaceae bacterium]
MGICILLAVGLQYMLPYLTLSRADVNVATLLFGLTAFLTLLIWFLRYSGYSVGLRYAIGWATLTIVLALAALLRIDHVSGDLVPTFAWRWRAKADRMIEAPTATVGEVDLASTTEHDFPQFLGPNRDGLLPDKTLDTDWQSRPPRLVWRTDVGAAWSGFSAVNGYAVTMEQRGNDELVTCYEIATGQLKWFHAVATRHQTLMGGVGPRSTPTIFEGKVYALGATGILCCLDGATGQVVWRDEILQRFGLTPQQDLNGIAWGRSASPLIVDRLVVVPWGGPAQGEKVSLAAYDKDTGEVIWTAGQYQASYSSPTLATLSGVRQILSVNQDFVTSHDPATGTILWEAAWPGNSSSNASVSQPVPLPGDRVLLSKGYGIGSKLLRVSQVDGSGWSVEQLWASSRALQTKFTNVVIRDQYAYALSDGILQCVDLADGRRVWRGGRYGQGQVLGIGDTLLVQAETGEIVCVAARPDRHEELAVFPALEGKTWNNPCLYDRYLLVRNAEHAACYEVTIRD